MDVSVVIPCAAKENGRGPKAGGVVVFTDPQPVSVEGRAFKAKVAGIDAVQVNVVIAS